MTMPRRASKLQGCAGAEMRQDEICFGITDNGREGMMWRAGSGTEVGVRGVDVRKEGRVMVQAKGCEDSRDTRK
jgi:hypothetical protein